MKCLSFIVASFHAFLRASPNLWPSWETSLLANFLMRACSRALASTGRSWPPLTHRTVAHRHNPCISRSNKSALISASSVKTREAFRDLRVEPSGKVTAANSYLKHNPKHYNQTNRRARTKLCLGQAAQNGLSSCGCKAVLQAPDFTSFFSRVT